MSEVGVREWTYQVRLFVHTPRLTYGLRCGSHQGKEWNEGQKPDTEVGETIMGTIHTKRYPSPPTM